MTIRVSLRKTFPAWKTPPGKTQLAVRDKWFGKWTRTKSTCYAGKMPGWLAPVHLVYVRHLSLVNFTYIAHSFSSPGPVRRPRNKSSVEARDWYGGAASSDKPVSVFWQVISQMSSSPRKETQRTWNRLLEQSSSKAKLGWDGTLFRFAV